VKGKDTPSLQMKHIIAKVIGKFGEFLALLLVLYPLSFLACSFY